MHNLRKEFPIYDHQSDLVYLDTAATSQTPHVVLNAMKEYYEHARANVHRGLYALSADATRRYEGARGDIGSFFGVGADRVIVTPGTTAALNGLARSLCATLQPGDEVVLTALEHHANLLPWQREVRERGATLSYIPITSEGTIDLVEAKRMITRKTKIVSVSWISNALGSVLPIAELTSIAHAVGAIIVVDGAQGAGHRSLDLSAIPIDVFVASGHKMYGPTGVGVVILTPALIATLEPWTLGGQMIEEVTYDDATWTRGTARFEGGTPPIAEVIGLGAAARLLTKTGMPSIEQHEHDLTTYALHALQSIDGITIFGPQTDDPTMRSGVISFAIDGLHPHDLATLLDRDHIAVRAGHHCAQPLMRRLGVTGTLRLSIGITTTREDIDRLIDALTRARSILQPQRKGTPS